MAGRHHRVDTHSRGLKNCRASGPLAALLDRYRDQLPMLFIVSEVVVSLGSTAGADELVVEVAKASGTKCERCWRVVPEVRTDPPWAGVCNRCVDALGGAVT